MASADGPFCATGMSMDTPIYRIHKHEHLEELLSGKLRVPSTRRWSDPYENLIAWCCYEVIGDDKRIKQTFLGTERFPTFVQCWTTVSESAAMCRIYCH